jgi:hypothetical protein
MTVGAGFACQRPMVAFMKSTSGRWKTDPLQPVKRIGLLGCSVVCGILELLHCNVRATWRGARAAVPPGTAETGRAQGAWLARFVALVCALFLKRIDCSNGRTKNAHVKLLGRACFVSALRAHAARQPCCLTLAMCMPHACHKRFLA